MLCKKKVVSSVERGEVTCSKASDGDGCLLMGNSDKVYCIEQRLEPQVQKRNISGKI